MPQTSLFEITDLLRVDSSFRNRSRRALSVVKFSFYSWEILNDKLSSICNHLIMKLSQLVKSFLEVHLVTKKA